MTERVTQESREFYTLTLFLTGRICIVDGPSTTGNPHGRTLTALFLNARHNRELGARKHRPLLAAPLRRMDNNASEMAKLAFCSETGAASGLWNLKGYDLAFTGLRNLSCPPEVKLDDLCNLNDVYKRVEPDAEWLTRKELVDAPDPRKRGIAARLSLAGFSSIVACDGFEGDGREITFLPGKHMQPTVRGAVKCVAEFRSGGFGPVLCGTGFNERSSLKYRLVEECDLTLAMSNLCTCSGHPVRVPAPTSGKERGGKEFFTHDDGEFRMYFDLLATPPAKDDRPQPCRERGTGAGNVAECYDPARLVVKGG